MSTPLYLVGEELMQLHVNRIFACAYSFCRYVCVSKHMGKSNHKCKFKPIISLLESSLSNVVVTCELACDTYVRTNRTNFGTLQLGHIQKAVIQFRCILIFLNASIFLFLKKKENINQCIN